MRALFCRGRVRATGYRPRSTIVRPSMCAGTGTPAPWSTVGATSSVECPDGMRPDGIPGPQASRKPFAACEPARRSCGPEPERADARGAHGVPCEARVPAHRQVGQVRDVRPMAHLVEARDARHHRVTAHGVDQLAERAHDLVADPIVLGAGRDHAARVSSADADADRARHLVVGDGEGAAPAAAPPARIPEVEQPRLEGLRQPRLDRVLPARRHPHLEDAPRIDARGARFGAGSARPPAVVERVEDLVQVPRRMAQRSHAVRREDERRRVGAGRRDRLLDLPVERAVAALERGSVALAAPEVVAAAVRRGEGADEHVPGPGPEEPAEELAVPPRAREDVVEQAPARRRVVTLAVGDGMPADVRLDLREVLPEGRAAQLRVRRVPEPAGRGVVLHVEVLLELAGIDAEGERRPRRVGQVLRRRRERRAEPRREEPPERRQDARRRPALDQRPLHGVDAEHELARCGRCAHAFRSYSARPHATATRALDA
jgi:hypothetical protein